MTQEREAVACAERIVERTYNFGELEREAKIVAKAFLALRSGGEGWRATLDFHDSDCATHNEPAEPNGPCNCWIESARTLLTKDWTDSEDHERFSSRYGASFLDAVDRVDAVRASPSTHGEG